MTKARPILFSGPMVRALLAGTKTQTRRLCKQEGCFSCNHPGNIIVSWNEHRRCRRCDGAGHEPPEMEWCPYGQPGDTLWVRETFCSPQKNIVGYRADAECGAWMGDGDGGRAWMHHGLIMESPAYQQRFENDQRWRTYGIGKYGGRWKPSIHMPRWASRLTLQVTDVRIQRLHDISEADAKAEGVQTHAQFYGQPEQKHLGTTPWYRYDGAACAATSARHSFETLWGSINGPDSWAENPWVWAITFRIALAGGGVANVSGDRLARGEGGVHE